MRRFTCVTAALLGLIGSSGTAVAGPLGPTPYLQASDSPFSAIDFSGGYFYLETFEDGALNTPGVAGTTGGVPLLVSSFNDSVDSDDGAVDGFGSHGNNWLSNSATTGFTFDAAPLGALPNHAGFVWTDGPFGTAVAFTAWGADGVTIVCSIPAGPAFGDNSFGGETAEDRFIGCSNAGGISRIEATNTLGGDIEVDHLQYGWAPSRSVPEPALISLFALGGALALRRPAVPRIIPFQWKQTSPRVPLSPGSLRDS